MKRKANHLIWLSASPGNYPDVLGSWDKQQGCAGRRRGSFHHLEEALAFGRALPGEVVRGRVVTPPLTWCGYGGSRQGRGALRRGAVGTLRSGRGSTPDCSIKGLQGHGAGARDWEERCVQMDELETRDSRQATPVQLGLCTALCSS